MISYLVVILASVILAFVVFGCGIFVGLKIADHIIDYENLSDQKYEYEKDKNGENPFQKFYDPISKNTYEHKANSGRYHWEDVPDIEEVRIVKEESN